MHGLPCSCGPFEVNRSGRLLYHSNGILSLSPCQRPIDDISKAFRAEADEASVLPKALYNAPHQDIHII